MKVCSRGRQQKHLNSFGHSRKEQDQRQSYCKDCVKLYRANHYRNNVNGYRDRNIQSAAGLTERNRLHILAYLQTHPCIDCGEQDPVVLQFDHVRGTKNFDLCTAPFKKFGLSKIDAEIAKCEVRCANCHLRVTANRLGSWKTKVLLQRISH